VGVASQERDPERVREGITRWLRARSGSAVEVAPLTRPTVGFSSDTFLVDASTGSLVIRLPPAGDGLFPVYDLGLQARLQEEVPSHGVPAAVPLAYEEDPSFLGAAFLVMPRVAGREVGDEPHRSWLREEGDDRQRALFEGFLDVLADIHRIVDVEPPPADGATPAWWAGYLEWAGDGTPHAVLADAVAWCTANQPAPAGPPGLLWGDVRLGNVLWGPDLTPTAVLDWEMASWGPAEIDLGWFFALREMATPPGRIELPGFLDRAASLERYSARLGRPVGDLEWYDVFAMVRSTAVLVRMQQLLRRTGQTDHWMLGFDPVPPRLRSLT
jgi:aminoglycoside phosphotransferase (APT) family kinase protein